MLTKKLNSMQVGSGTSLDIVAKGAVATDDGSNTVINFDAMIAVATVAITAAEMKALRATPKELVAAPGAGYVLEFVSATFIYDYTAAFTESSDDIAVRFTNGSGVIASTTLDATGLLDATSDQIRTLKALTTDITPVANAALVLHNTGDGEWGGTGSPCRVKIAYRVHATGL
jgi:hypothetical protein